MTENEAIIELHKIRPRGSIIPQKRAEALDVAIQAIEKQSMVNEILHELREYSAIGTIEEFKALKEKNTPKKPKKSGVTDSKGIFHAINGINGVPYDLCPNCEINLCTDGMFGGNKSGIKYCKNCGQKLDWQ